MAVSEYTYRPAWWVPGSHAQTVWARLFRRSRPLPLARIELRTPDGDYLELHSSPPRANEPRLFLLHGLEGSTRSPYVGGIVMEAIQRGFGADVLIFRGCGQAANIACRFYHSGETQDLAFAVQHVMRASPGAPLLLAGVSLGGNVLLKWLGEIGDSAPPAIAGAAVVSVPFDLERGARRLMLGFSRVYDQFFLRSLKRKALAKHPHFPESFDAAALLRARTLYDFDEVVTAPVHGFASASDYYTQSSSMHFLRGIAVPTLLLASRDDPFIPSSVLDDAAVVARDNPLITTEFHDKGGHVGFVSGRIPGRATYYAERRAVEFLAQTLTGRNGSRAVA